jgi:hypothetical protein
VLLQFNKVIKKGAWLAIDEEILKEVKAETGEDMEVQHNGIDNLRKYLEDNAKITDFLFTYLKKRIAK